MLLELEKSTVLLVDVQEKLTPYIAENEQTVANCAWVLRLANSLAVKVVATEQYPQGLGATVAALQPYLQSKPIISKRGFSCLFDADCNQQLKSHLSKQVVVIGIEAHVCVLQTAIDLHNNGFEVFVVADAVSSRNPKDKKLALKRMRHLGIQVVSKEMVFFEWLRTSLHPHFKELSKQFLQ